MANEIDLLMDLDPMEMTSANIDSIIAYHRKARAAAATGGPRPKRGSGESSTPIDLEALGLAKPKAVETIKRRL